MNHLRYWTILGLGWLDDTIVRHQFYSLCCLRALHPWLKALCGGGCTLGSNGCCVRCGWREVEG